MIYPPVGYVYVTQRLWQLRYDQDPDLKYPSPMTLNRAWATALKLFEKPVPSPSVLPDDDAVEFIWRRAGMDIEITIPAIGPTVLWVRKRETNISSEAWLSNQWDHLFDLLLNKV